jgi:hypothetical protein
MKNRSAVKCHEQKKKQIFNILDEKQKTGEDILRTDLKESSEPPSAYVCTYMCVNLKLTLFRTAT